jgi:hypothetical protein
MFEQKFHLMLTNALIPAGVIALKSNKHLLFFGPHHGFKKKLDKFVLINPFITITIDE